MSSGWYGGEQVVLKFLTVLRFLKVSLFSTTLKVVGVMHPSRNLNRGETMSDHKYIFQNNETNLSFATARASTHTIEIRSLSAQVSMTEAVATSPFQLLELIRQAGIGPSFSGTFQIVDTTHQTSGVSVAGWDYQKKEELVGEAQSRVVPSQNRVMASMPSTNTGSAADEVKSALVSAGYSRASFSIS